MEQQLQHEQDPVDTLGGEVSSLDGHRQVPHVAGHILLHKTPHKGEISLTAKTEPRGPAFQPIEKRYPTGEAQKDANKAVVHLGEVAASAAEAPTPTRKERSAWHEIDLDSQGNVLERDYGQGFKGEQRAEMGMQPPADITGPIPQSIPGQGGPIQTISAQPDDPMNPDQSTAFGKLEMPTAVPQPTKSLPANPLYAALPGVSALEQAPASVKQADFSQQQLSQLPLGNPTTQQSIDMSGAVNPSFAQPMQPQEPHFPAMVPASAKVQHRLPVGKSHIKVLLTSPWVWLTIGVGIILYFSRSVFN